MSEGSEEYFERLVDEEALASFLEEHLGTVDDYHIERHQEGHSNETLFVTWGDQELVIRRPPPGETAESAHDVLREHRVLSALGDTDVPAPATVAACDDHSIIGSDFYVMEREDGVVLRTEEPEQFADPEHRGRIGEEMVDTLARIHAVDYEAVGLEEFGHPDGFTQRQVDRWQKQFAWAFEVTEDHREVPEVYEIGDWLQDNVPEDHPHTLVHGDYKLDNVMFGHDTPPELVSVFDWEMSTLGDPFTDVGWLLSYWPDEENEAIGTDDSSAFLTREGYPTSGELVEHYQKTTGREFTNDRFYRVLAVYKLGALGEMFFRRHLQGNADDDMYPMMEERVPALADRAMTIIEGDAEL
jgi:aminoglycoside phosphotransferase (APT) family kinase protein